MKSKKRLLLLLFTIVIVSILIMSVDAEVAIEALKGANWWYIVAAALVTLMFPLLCAIRWNLIVLQMGRNLGVWESFKIVMAAWPLGTITPAKSGDLIKVLFLKKILPYSKTTGVILAERLMDVVSLCVYSVIGGILYGFEQAVLFSGTILVGVAVFFVLSTSSMIKYVPQKWRTLVENVLDASKRMCLHWRTFILIAIVSLFNWYLSFFQVWLCYLAFHVSVPMSFTIGAFPLCIFIGLIPVTISGMGTRDSAIIYLFKDYAPYEINLAVGLFYSLFGYWILSLMGIPFMRGAIQGAIGDVRGEELKRNLLAGQDFKEDTTENS